MGDGYQEVQEVISIHAPTRGATSLKATEYKLSIDFNPRSHERSDYDIRRDRHGGYISIHAPTRGATKVACYLATLIKFQSTLPREERPVRRYSLPLISVNFNPRSHERSDNIQNLTFALTKRFQSTLPREERPRRHAPAHKIARNFNPRSHERSDGDVNKIDCGGSVISIHAPTRGATEFSL